nr:reverse transcriptase domain-containing protein [Tanacetum cinerariifolium]
MMDNQTMEELLQAPTEGHGEAIVILEINADHFEIKTNLLQLVQANPYHGFERENPHTHINNFKRITSTLKFRDVPNDVIKLMMFSYIHSSDPLEFDTGESAKLTTLGAAATGTGGTAIVRGIMYSSNIGWNKRFESALFDRIQGRGFASSFQLVVADQLLQESSKDVKFCL